jgi:TPP-dependent pyruvate/acetoin dehydrogenase alpha subunit
VDGNDILAVYTASKEAIDRARAGEGPTLIENVTYRMMMHTTADDPKRYRTDKEVSTWKKRDPIIRFQKYLIDKGVLSEKKIDTLEEDIKAEIQGAVDNAEAMMKKAIDPMDMFKHAYDELPPYTEQQRKELEEELEETGKEGNHA